MINKRPEDISPRQRQKMAKVSVVVNRAIKAMDQDRRKRNLSIDKGMFAERLKQDHMLDVVNELEGLSNQKIQFLKHNFNQVKNKWKDHSESEL